MTARCLLVLLAAWASAPQVLASAVGIGFIEQPVNLGPQADPASIPLGPVPYESNYSFGIHAVVSASRPCPGGAMTWDGGSILEQNLAREFGILVEAEDATDFGKPVVLRVKPWPKPAYSPYSREQVLAATLHCLLRAVRPGPKRPMPIRIVAENPADGEWAGRFAGKYSLPRRSDDPTGEAATPIPGTRIETDAWGVAHVVFPGVTAKAAEPPPRPVLIPCPAGGEWEAGPLGGISCALIPMWAPALGEPLDLLGQPVPLFYDCFNPARPGMLQANALFASRGIEHYAVQRKPEGIAISLGFLSIDEGTLVGFVHAAILSAGPTKECPLTLALNCYADPPAYLRECTGPDGGWSSPEEGDARRIYREFAPEKNPPLAAAMPRAKVELDENGTWWVAVGPQEDPSFPEPLLQSYQWYFGDGLTRGKFEPLPDSLPEDVRNARPDWIGPKFWQAGYRAAVLPYYDPHRIEDPPEAPYLKGPFPINQRWMEGWSAGNRQTRERARMLLEERKKELEGRDPQTGP